MPGVLYVVATPIGNLEDWTLRAQRVLGEVDLLLAEDTRHTPRLLDRYGIRVPLRSYHDFNEASRAEAILGKLRAGARVALVSDQGTPTISDPGYRLVRLCREEGIPVIPIPGPSAVIAALSVSGLPTDEFHFVGFLPSRKQARRRKIETLRNLGVTLVLYESPHRVEACLRDLSEILGDRLVSVAREMTKLHEEYVFGRVSEVGSRVRPKGEVVIVVEGASGIPEAGEPAPDLTGASRQELLKAIAGRLGVSRKALYDALYKK